MKVLLVDDSVFSRRLTEKFVDELGMSFISACGGEEAWHIFQADSIDVVITDMVMPNGLGEELVDKLRNVSKELPIAVFSSNKDISKINMLKEKGVYYVNKYDFEALTVFLSQFEAKASNQAI